MPIQRYKLDQGIHRQMVRSIEVVKDHDALQPEQRFCTAASLLNSLSAPQLSQFRYEVRIRYKDRNPRLLCANCGKPVYVSLSGAGNPDQRDGRDAFFAHHAGTADECEWGTRGENPQDINRLKYGGAHEGAQHKRLKTMLASMLEVDAAFSNIMVEQVISRPPHWRKPDVMASFLDGLIAFDLQLATTQLPAIVGRETFYETNDLRYMWVTSTDDPARLALQTFQDIYWNNDAQIFMVDAHAEDTTLQLRELHLWAMSVAPRLDDNGLRSVWERRLVARSAIDWGTASRRPRFSDANFDAAFRKLVTERFANPKHQMIIAAGQKEHIGEAGRAWDEIAGAVGAPRWAESDRDKIFKAIGVLASAAAGKKMDASRYAANAMTAMFNQFLETDPCRGWTATLQQVATAYGNEDLLSAASTQAKIARNLGEDHPDLQRRYAAMLDIIFPKTALSRLGGPPSEIVDV